MAAVEPSQVDKLSKDQKLIMLGLCRRLEKKQKSILEMLRNCTGLSVRNKAKPKSYTTFWKHLKFLENQGLIETRSDKSNVGRGRTQYISMNNIAPANLANRIEKELQR